MTLAEAWYRRRTYHHRDYTPALIADVRTDTVTVCVPARETATTIGPIVECLLGLREQNVIDAVMVVDAGSLDGTADVAARAGAEVHQEASLLPQFGPPLGKGDAMWRSLSVTTTGVVAFVDADTEEFGEHFVCGMLGALLCEPGVDFIKGFYRRPFKSEGVAMPEGGGRVTELPARPVRARAVGVRVLDRDRAPDRRLQGRRARGDGPGRPRRAPEPPPAARQAGRDGLRRAGGGRAAARTRGAPAPGRARPVLPVRARRDGASRRHAGRAPADGAAAGPGGLVALAALPLRRPRRDTPGAVGL